MAIQYEKEKYKFVFREFYNPYFILNPNKRDAVCMAFDSEKFSFLIEGPANEDFSGFKEGADFAKMRLSILPKGDESKIWTEALVEDLKIIPIGQKDEIRIKATGMPLPRKLSEILKDDTHVPVVKRALIGIKEADEVVRKSFPGYCLTGVKIE